MEEGEKGGEKGERKTTFDASNTGQFGLRAGDRHVGNPPPSGGHGDDLRKTEEKKDKQEWRVLRGRIRCRRLAQGLKKRNECQRERKKWG